MTPAIAQHSGHGDPGWTGFVLLIVPVGGAEAANPELARLVDDRIRSDVVLADTVRVAGGPAIDGAGPEQAYAVANALVRTAMDGPRRLFAPRAVFGCVLVGQDAQEAERLADALAQTGHLSRLPVYFFGVGGADLAESVTEVTNRVLAMVESYERWPDFVLDEQRFRALLRPPRPTSAPALRPAERAADPWPPTTSGATYQLSPRGARPRLPQHAPVHRGWRDMLRPRRRRPATQAEALQRLADDGYAVDLVYFVLVAENERTSRALRTRRLQLLLELDSAYAQLEADLVDGDAPVIEVALYTAGRSLVRHGPLRPAGQLANTRLPKVGLDYVDLVECVGAVRDAYGRELASLNRRGIDVPRASVIFISASPPLADSEAVDRFHALCAECRVAWILLGADHTLMSEEFTAAGALVLPDHPDIVHEMVGLGFVGVVDESGPQRPPAPHYGG